MAFHQAIFLMLSVAATIGRGLDRQAKRVGVVMLAAPRAAAGAPARSGLTSPLSILALQLLPTGGHERPAVIDHGPSTFDELSSPSVCSSAWSTWVGRRNPSP